MASFSIQQKNLQIKKRGEGKAIPVTSRGGP
jgi:hypothetical protein